MKYSIKAGVRRELGWLLAVADLAGLGAEAFL